MKITCEKTDHLCDMTLVVLCRALGHLRTNDLSMDEAFHYLRQELPAWFVYRGGSHIAIHSKPGDCRRIVIITP